MPIKSYRPTTKSMRGRTVVDYSELTRTTPEKSLCKGKRSTGGRNNMGRITTRFRGSGNKRTYRMVDFRRNKDNMTATVQQIEYDPNRSAFIALIAYEDGEKTYILAPVGMKVGQKVISADKGEIQPGNAFKLRNIPLGVQIHNIELVPGKGGRMARAAGQVATLRAKDGDTLAKGGILLQVEGPSRALLTAERVSLNFLQRLSGVATIARRFVDEVAGTKAKILDTRKTLPGWRMFEKYAVACGGATNHRIGLYDMILIKDNHLVALRDAQPNAVAAAVARARSAYPQLKVEVEADNLTQVAQAVEAGADIILLDNMTNEMMREAVQSVQGRALLEASGGVNLKTVRGKAETGVDFISVGALTHSAPSVDIGLDFF